LRKDADVKRDMELVREVLLAIEQDSKLDGTRLAAVSLPGHDQGEVAYVLGLLIDAGFATGPTRRPPGAKPIAKSLTWNWHELLNNIRDPGIWEKAKERAKPFLGAGIGVLAEIAKEEIKKRLNLP